MGPRKDQEGPGAARIGQPREAESCQTQSPRNQELRLVLIAPCPSGGCATYSCVMVMTIQPNGQGGYIVAQKLRKPVVYLDHWAIRMFCDARPLQDRFLAALHRAGATWLFSQINLFEFVAVTDLQQAAAAEAMLLRAMPNVQVADLTMDKGYLLRDGAPHHEDAPDEHWMLQDIAARAQIAGGEWNMHNFIADCIHHRDTLLPLFDEMKQEAVEKMTALAQEPQRVALAKRFVPTPGMTLREGLMHELLRDVYVNPAYQFTGNDAVDLNHALGPALVCDFTLLDARWCRRMEIAAKRLQEGGVVVKRLGKPYTKRTVPEFLMDFEALPTAA